jgi:hypothetical protein
MIECLKDEHCKDGKVCTFEGKCTKYAALEGSRCSESVKCPSAVAATKTTKASLGMSCAHGRCRENCADDDNDPDCLPLLDGKKVLMANTEGFPYDCFEADKQFAIEPGVCKLRSKTGERCPTSFEGSRFPCEEGLICARKNCRILCAPGFGCDENRKCLKVASLNGSIGLCLTEEEASEFLIDVWEFPPWALALSIAGAIILFGVLLYNLLPCIWRRRRKAIIIATDRKKRELAEQRKAAEDLADDDDEYEYYTDEESFKNGEGDTYEHNAYGGNFSAFNPNDFDEKKGRFGGFDEYGKESQFHRTPFSDENEQYHESSRFYSQHHQLPSGDLKQRNVDDDHHGNKF